MKQPTRFAQTDRRKRNPRKPCAKGLYQAECLEKCEGSRQVGDWDVEGDLFDHVREISTPPSTNERADAGQGVVLFAWRSY